MEQFVALIIKVIVFSLDAAQHFLEASSIRVVMTGFDGDRLGNDGPHRIEQGLGSHTLTMKRYLDQSLSLAAPNT
ncbi:hypothetical protein [Bradyrhizobium sp. RDM4]|uniref:hypothetical protein n=1 Tax=Bradyrhizobium sp. RDM4 TaxID=3378765 RepID=UPI0038FC10F3